MSSKSLNRVLLIGNVTRDPELRYTPQGNAVVSFGLATNRSWKTDTGEIKEEAEFHRLVAWNKLAEICAKFCLKGRKIYVEGRLQTRTWTGTQDNLQHTVTEIVIDDMILLGSPVGAAGAPMSAGQPTVAPVSVAVSASPAPVVPAPAAEEPEKDEEGEKGKKNKREKKEEKPASTESFGEVKPAVVTGDSGEVKPFDAAQGKEDVNVDDIPF